MRDGTILRADVHRPDRGGPYPVLVQRTPYGKAGNFDRFVKAGYIVVSQDVRGRYESEGKWEGFWRISSHAAPDGYDTVEWAANLPGSSHKVGTFGRSASGNQQWRLAPLHPPSLVAISAQSMPVSRHDQESTGTIRPGALLRGFVTVGSPDMRRRTNSPGVHTEWEGLKLWKQDESEKWVNFLPRIDLPQELFQDQADSIKYWLKYPHFDPLRLHEVCRDISVPNLDVIGWYDFANGDLLLFRTMIKEAKTGVARRGSRVIIGPWSHASPGRRHFGPIDFGPAAQLDIKSLQIRWFDYWLKSVQNGVDKDAPVRIFIMGDNRWRDEQSWPLQRAKEKIFFITSEGHANTTRGGGRIVSQKPDQSTTDQYVYDPNDPVPTPFDSSLRLFPVDQRPLADRKDILVYQTEPLSERFEVTGNPVVELYAASSAPDTDWFVRLIDVAPDGRALNVSEGAVRARYRNGFDKPSFLKPGEVVRYSIRMRPTSNAFLAGHRIRLDITSSDFPNYDRNHNTAADQNADATLAIANQTIHHGGKWATRIVLPWVPNPTEEEPTGEATSKPELNKQMYPLHQAAADGDIERVRLLISKGSNINSQDEKKNTPLRRAVESAKMELVRLLVEAGADVNAGSWPPLCMAVDENNIAIAKYLIAHGANVNAPEGWTALQEAPYIANNIEMVELLIAKGADVNAGPYTALHAAVQKDRLDIVELLIAKGANVNAQNKSGMT
ncbi:MAG: CocE/NonD family hydrolase, partial [Planctomycetota bacterium]